MKKLKVIFDWLLRFGLSALLVAFVVMAPFTLFPSLVMAEANVNRNEVYEYQGILELWHIETFEGGSRSRATFLEQEAINFEKNHKGTYIVIQTMSLEQFKLNIEAGKKPNMLSFGVGGCDGIEKELVEIDADAIRGDLKSYGKYGAKQLAVPYILGGYAMIEQKLQSEDSKTNANMSKTGVGLKGTTNPLKALQAASKQIATLYDDISMDSYDAYDKFLKGYYGTLIGTQRDVYRIESRQQKGLMTDCKFNFLGRYTDLVQYMSVFEGKEIEEKLCKEFVSQMISENVQKKLKNYNLFSTLENVSLYDSGIYADFEKALSGDLKSENAFVSNEEIRSMKQEALKNVVK